MVPVKTCELNPGFFKMCLPVFRIELPCDIFTHDGKAVLLTGIPVISRGEVSGSGSQDYDLT